MTATSVPRDADIAQGGRSGAMRASGADSHVIVAGDIFRLIAAPGGRWAWHQEENIYWLAQIVQGAFASNPAIRVGVLDHAALGMTLSDFKPGYGEAAEERWVGAVTAPLSPELAARVQDAIAGKVVIAFEVPDNLRLAMEKTSLALLDLEIAPFRFLKDILLSARSAHPGLQATIDRVAVGERELWWRFGEMRARMGRPSADEFGEIRAASLIAAQTPADRALIEEGALLNLGDFLPEIQALAENGNLVILTPHPHSIGRVVGLEVLASVAGIKISTANSYRLIATGNIDRVVAISSSLLDEARFFGITAIRLARPRTRRGMIIGPSSLGADIADEIARIGGFALPALTHATGDEFSGASHGGNDWAYASIRDARPFFTGLLVDTRPCHVPAHDATFATALTFGWHGLEPWGVWSGRVGVLGIVWPDDAVSQLLCQLMIYSPRSDAAPQNFTIWYEGKRILRHQVFAIEPCTIDFEIARPTQPGPAQIWLVSERIFRPSEHLPGYEDARELGIGLGAMTIR